MQLHSRTGHLEVFRCDSCGWEAAGTFTPAADVAGWAVELERCQIRLDAPVTGTRELVAIRKLFPELANRSIAELKNQLGTGASLGFRSRGVAEELESEARENGISLLLEPVK